MVIYTRRPLMVTADWSTYPPPRPLASREFLVSPGDGRNEAPAMVASVIRDQIWVIADPLCRSAYYEQPIEKKCNWPSDLPTPIEPPERVALRHDESLYVVEVAHAGPQYQVVRYSLVPPVIDDNYPDYGA